MGVTFACYFQSHEDYCLFLLKNLISSEKYFYFEYIISITLVIKSCQVGDSNIILEYR